MKDNFVSIDELLARANKEDQYVGEGQPGNQEADLVDVDIDDVFLMDGFEPTIAMQEEQKPVDSIPDAIDKLFKSINYRLKEKGLTKIIPIAGDIINIRNADGTRMFKRKYADVSIDSGEFQKFTQIVRQTIGEYEKFGIDEAEVKNEGPDKSLDPKNNIKEKEEDVEWLDQPTKTKEKPVVEPMTFKNQVNNYGFKLSRPTEIKPDKKAPVHPEAVSISSETINMYSPDMTKVNATVIVPRTGNTIAHKLANKIYTVTLKYDPSLDENKKFERSLPNANAQHIANLNAADPENQRARELAANRIDFTPDLAEGSRAYEQGAHGVDIEPFMTPAVRAEAEAKLATKINLLREKIDNPDKYNDDIDAKQAVTENELKPENLENTLLKEAFLKIKKIAGEADGFKKLYRGEHGDFLDKFDKVKKGIVAKVNSYIGKGPISSNTKVRFAVNASNQKFIRDYKELMKVYPNKKTAQRVAINNYRNHLIEEEYGKIFEDLSEKMKTYIEEWQEDFKLDYEEATTQDKIDEYVDSQLDKIINSKMFKNNNPIESPNIDVYNRIIRLRENKAGLSEDEVEMRIEQAKDDLKFTQSDRNYYDDHPEQLEDYINKQIEIIKQGKSRFNENDMRALEQAGVIDKMISDYKENVRKKLEKKYGFDKINESNLLSNVIEEVTRDVESVKTKKLNSIPAKFDPSKDNIDKINKEIEDMIYEEMVKIATAKANQSKIGQRNMATRNWQKL